MSARASSVIHHQYFSGSAPPILASSAFLRHASPMLASGGELCARKANTHSVAPFGRSISLRLATSSATCPGSFALPEGIGAAVVVVPTWGAFLREALPIWAFVDAHGGKRVESVRGK